MGNSFLDSIDILVVEDNPGDARLIRETLNGNGIYNSLYIVDDGVEALSFLRNEGKYEGMPRPDMIILDLNLPKKDGREVLAEIKSDEQLCHIPVVVMTISQAEEDILNTYKLHANCYITKPIDLNEFIRIVSSVEEFWFSVVRLPPKTETKKW